MEMLDCFKFTMNDKSTIKSCNITFSHTSVAVNKSNALVDDNRNALVGQLLVAQRVAAVERDCLDVLAKHCTLFLVAQLKGKIWV